MTLKEIRARLSELNISEVARRIGMTRQQLWLIANGISANPTATTMQKIADYLESQE